MKNYILLLSLIIVVTSHAQLPQQPVGDAAFAENNPFSNSFQQRNPILDQIFRQLNQVKEFNTQYVSADKGSAYENESFQKAKVFYNKELLGNLYYRHNAFTKEIEVKKTQLEEEEFKALLKNEEIMLIPSKGGEKRFLRFRNKKDRYEEDYLTQLSKGKSFELYKRFVVKYTEAKPAANSLVKATPSRFTNFNEYYLKQTNSETIFEISTKKNKLLSALMTKKEIAKTYLKKEKLDLDNELDLIRLFDYLNTN